MNRRRRAIPDKPAPTRRPAARVRLTYDPDGYSHLSADGLHHDSAEIAQTILETFRDADARDDEAAAAADARRRRPARGGHRLALVKGPN